VLHHGSLAFSGFVLKQTGRPPWFRVAPVIMQCLATRQSKL
jgi:hypothetical protein